MAATIGALLDEARRRTFVGRATELAAFDACLTGDSGRPVLFLHGAGGMGKTTLLDRFRARAAEHGLPVVSLDGREHDVSDRSVADAVAALDHDAATPVLLVDGYESLAPLDDWFREQLVRSLPAGTVVVIAGREPPSLGWRRDPGWRRLTTVLPLGAFSRDEGVQLLGRVGVDAASHDRLLALARGHPLALALLGDAVSLGEVPDDLASIPDVVEALLPLFVSRVPTEAHALGLELCAHVWVITRDLLAFVLGDDAAAVWAWLASLPFVTAGALGLYPHDLARDVLRAEHLRRAPDGRLRVHHLLHRYGRSALRRLLPAEAHVAAIQLLHLHKDTPLTRGFWALRDNESVSVLPGRGADHADVVGLVERFEGEATARLATRWLDAQPGGLRVVRRQLGVEAFAFEPVLPAESALEVDDPVVRQVLDGIARLAPLRPGERVSVGRFFGGRTSYQADPHAVVCGSVSSLITWQTAVLAWSWIVTVDPDFWVPIFDHLGFDHRLELTGDRRRVAFGMDWRRIGVERWLEVMSGRELSGESGPMPSALLRPPPLGRPSFDAAVRSGLRSLHRPDELAGNPPVGAQAVDAGGAGLAAALRRAVGFVGAVRGDEELARVLHQTYVQAPLSQEAAAAALHLSFSTYRRRLGRALDAVCDVLWAVEIGERRLDAERGRLDAGPDTASAVGEEPSWPAAEPPVGRV